MAIPRLKNLSIAGGRIVAHTPFLRVLTLCERQTATSKIWTRVADDNHYTTVASKIFKYIYTGIRRIGFMPLQQGVEAKYGIIFKTFFSLISQVLEKKRDIANFSWLALLFQHFLIKIQPIMSEQEKKWQRIYDFLNTKTKPKNFQNNWSFIMAYIKPRKRKQIQRSHPNIGLFNTAIKEK